MRDPPLPSLTQTLSGTEEWPLGLSGSHEQEGADDEFNIEFSPKILNRTPQSCKMSRECHDLQNLDPDPCEFQSRRLQVLGARMNAQRED